MPAKNNDPRAAGLLRLAKLLFALGVGGAALHLMLVKAPEAQQGPAPSPPADVPGLQAALIGNAGSPYRWVELAEGYDQAGDAGKARECFTRAEELGPSVPPVWIRAAAFHLQRGEIEAGLRAAAHAQAISGTADDFLFQYYDHFVRDTPAIVRALGADRRALTSYHRHLMAKNNAGEAGMVWRELKGRGWADRAAAVSYLDFLLRQHRYEAAEAVWVQEAPRDTRDGYPERNRIYNGGFEQVPTASQLDWKIAPTETVDAVRDSTAARTGRYSLRVHFPGTDNVTFRGVTQNAIVTPGTYRFTAWLKMDGITTDEGIRFCISDAELPERLDLRTEPVRGTRDWFEIEREVTAPPHTNLLKITLCRLASEKFDSKVSGTAWVDDVGLRAVREAPVNVSRISR